MPALNFKKFKNFRSLLTTAATLLLVVSIISLAYVINVKKANKTTPTDSSAASNQLEGKLVVVKKDDFENSKYTEEYYLQKSDLTHTKLNSKEPLGLYDNSRVSLSGETTSEGFGVSSVSVTSEAAQAAVTTGTNRAVVLLSNFNNFTTATPTKSTIEGLMTTAAVSVQKMYKEYSHDKLNLSTSVHDWKTMNLAKTCGVNEIARAALLAHDATVDYNNVETIILVVRHPECDAATGGLTFSFDGVINGVRVNKPIVIMYHDTFTLQKTAHEIGHTLGLGHANMLDCNTATMGYDGACTNIEYGDRADIMSSYYTLAHPNSHYKRHLGWLPSSQVVTPASGTSTITLDPIETISSGPKAIRIPIGTTGMAYYIENREQWGFDAQVVTPERTYNSIDNSVRDGAVIHIAPVPHNWANTQVLDMVPAPNGGIDYFQTGLPLATTYSDPRFPITIKPVSNEAVAGARKLTVQVTVGSFSATNPTSFNNLSATLDAGRAEFRFGFPGVFITRDFIIDVAKNSAFTDSVYFGFGFAQKSPVVVSDVTKWGDYRCGQTIYWKARTLDDTVISPVQTAVVCGGGGTLPSAPTLSTPGNGGQPAGVRPVFRWNASTGGPAGYQIVVDTENTFASPYTINLSNIVATSAPSYTPTADLARYRTYYWKVRAKNSANPVQWGPWSPTWSFTIVNPAVTLTAPATGSVSQTTRPTLSWSAPPAGFTAAGFQIQIDNQNTFALPLVIDNPNIAAAARSYTPTIDLARVTNYYWRVRYKNSSNQWSAWSVAANIKISRPAPVNQAPTNTTQPLRPTFRWSAVIGATSYRLQIATTSNYQAGTVIGYMVTPTSYTIPTNLLAKTRYYYRVRGEAGPFNPTPFSTGGTFMTQ